MGMGTLQIIMGMASYSTIIMGMARDNNYGHGNATIIMGIGISILQ
jgi:hypothetical protein